MNTGKVKFYNAKSGYGFIIDDKSGNEVFFHVEALQKNRIHTDSIQQETLVRFQLNQGERGDFASDIELI